MLESGSWGHSVLQTPALVDLCERIKKMLKINAEQNIDLAYFLRIKGSFDRV